MSRPPKKSGEKSGANYSTIFGSGKSDSEKIQSFGVILEHLDSKMDYVIEAGEAFQASLTRKIEEVDQRLTAEIKLTQLAVRDNREEILKNRQAVQSLEVTVQRLEGAVQVLDAKVDKIGQRLDTVDVKLDEHDRLLAVR